MRVLTTLGHGLAKLAMTGLVAVAATFGAAKSADAVSLSAWTFTGPGMTSTGGTTESPSFTYNMNPAGYGVEQTWTAEATVLTSGTYKFDWVYFGFHAYAGVTAFLNSINPSEALVVKAAPVNCCTSPSNGFNFSGTETWTVTAGQTIGFTFGGENFDANNVLSGTLAVTEVAVMPLPAGALLLLTGFGALAIQRRRQRDLA